MFYIYLFIYKIDFRKIRNFVKNGCLFVASTKKFWTQQLNYVQIIFKKKISSTKRKVQSLSPMLCRALLLKRKGYT